MTETAIEPEVTTPVQPEQANTESAPANPLADMVAASRAEILGEDVASEEVAEAPEDQPLTSDEDSDADDARTLLASEKRSREEREALKTERELWLSEQSETIEKIEAFNASREDIEIDPLAHLQTAGLTDEALMDLGREIFFTFMPDSVTPEIKAEMASLKQARRLAKLEKGMARKTTPEKSATQPKLSPEEYATYEANYKTSLSDAASGIDSEQFPLAAAFEPAALEDAMWKVAVQHAQASPKSGDLSPLQTLEAIEDFLRRNPDAQEKTETHKPEEASRPSKQAHRSLRNRTAAAKPNTKTPQTYEEKLAAAESRARAMLNL